MDTPEAFAATNPVPITRMSESFDEDQPIVLIDADTGQRQLIWTELDSNATSPAQTDLLIHFGKNLEDGHRYIVALRGMKDANGDPIEAPKGFQLYRDGIPTGIPAIEQRRDHMEDVFDDLGVRRHRPRRPLHGLGLHGRQHREHHRPDALDAGSGIRRPRRHGPDRRRHGDRPDDGELPSSPSPTTR